MEAANEIGIITNLEACENKKGGIFFRRLEADLLASCVSGAVLDHAKIRMGVEFGNKFQRHDGLERKVVDAEGQSRALENLPVEFSHRSRSGEPLEARWRQCDHCGTVVLGAGYSVENATSRVVRYLDRNRHAASGHFHGGAREEIDLVIAQKGTLAAGASHKKALNAKAVLPFNTAGQGFQIDFQVRQKRGWNGRPKVETVFFGRGRCRVRHGLFSITELLFCKTKLFR